MGDEDRRADVQGDDVPPGEIFSESSPTSPALKPGAVHGTLHDPVLEQDVLDRGVEAITTKRADRQTVGCESTISVLGYDILGPMNDRNAVIPIMPVVPIESDVLPGEVEPVAEHQTYFISSVRATKQERANLLNGKLMVSSRVALPGAASTKWLKIWTFCPGIFHPHAMGFITLRSLRTPFVTLNVANCGRRIRLPMSHH